MTVRLIALADHEAWLRMRRDLWPDCPEEIHRHEMTQLQRGSPYAVVFLSEDPGGAPEGFVEVSIRPFAEGCHSGRVGYVEGWYVAPGSRRDRSASPQGESSYHLTLLAQNRTGFANLMQLSSKAFLEGFYHKPRIDREHLVHRTKGCFVPCLVQG